MNESQASNEHAVGPESSFPDGAHKVVRIRNMEIGIFNVNGTLYALRNVCPHQYGPLCEGPVGGEMICNAKTNWRFQWGRSGEILTCPWHGLEFDLTTGQCLAAKQFKVRQFPVRVVDGEVRVRLGVAQREAASTTS
jgi:nitrite reductase (NADH) small subunit